MSDFLSKQIIQPKKKRGGQPGNKNSKGNSGNKNARGLQGNRGGIGASYGNQYARKSKTLASELFKDYANNCEAVAWLEQNRNVLNEIEVRSDVTLDQAMFKGVSLDKFDANFSNLTEKH